MNAYEQKDVAGSPVTETEAATWAAGLQERLANYHLQAGNAGTPPTIELEFGPRWIRIVLLNPRRSAYGFIARETGLLYKSAGWKAPAKWARGNMRGPRPYQACGPYGMAYLR